MVENTIRNKKTSSDERSGKTKKEIKATTGAWWKSTVTETREEEPEPVLEESPAAGDLPAPLEEKSQPVRAKRPRRKKKSPDKAEDKKKQAEGKKSLQDSDKKTKAESSFKDVAEKGEKEQVPSPGARVVAEEDILSRVETETKTSEDFVPEEIPKVQGPAEEIAREEGTSAAALPMVMDPPEGGVERQQATVPEAVEKKKSGRPRRGKRGSKKHDETKVQADSAKETTQRKAQAEPEEAEQSGEEGSKAVLKLLINAEEPEECRLALLENGRLESIYVSTVTRAHTKNNIYKAKIVALEANLQAAFVDYGTEKNGFLPFGEIHPEYYRQEVNEKTRKLVEQHQWKKLSITDVLEKGQEVLVQVVKEEIGTKGANMTTYLSLPGRCVVLLPGSDSSGISRKISGEERRSQLREMMESMNIPEGIGWIVRTASNDINKAALTRDVTYLLRLWSEVKKRGQDMEGVGLIYQDHDSVLRFLRENFDSSIEEILVDDSSALEQVKGFIAMLPPKQRTTKVKLHRGARPIFNQYSVEDQIESIYQPRVSLPSGGSIVIDQTEALVAIDVNSGSTSKEHNFEASIFQANMEAAAELARQLRLRDLGGLIVVDFIDMRSQKNIREVEKQVKAAMKRDKAKVDISRISKFGLMQISRQKLGAPIDSGTYRVCEHCKGRGTVRSIETLALFYLRRIQTGASRKQVHQVQCHFPLDVAQYLLNKKRQELIELEKRYDTEINIVADPSLKPGDHEIVYQRAEKETSAKKQA